MSDTPRDDDVSEMHDFLIAYDDYLDGKRDMPRYVPLFPSHSRASHQLEREMAGLRRMETRQLAVLHRMEEVCTRALRESGKCRHVEARCQHCDASFVGEIRKTDFGSVGPRPLCPPCWTRHMVLIEEDNSRKRNGGKVAPMPTARVGQTSRPMWRPLQLLRRIVRWTTRRGQRRLVAGSR